MPTLPVQPTWVAPVARQRLQFHRVALIFADEGEVERIKQRHQEMTTLKNTMENAGKDHRKDGRNNIEGAEMDGGRAGA